MTAERITLRVMVRKDGVTRIMLVCTHGPEITRENWGTLPRSRPWTKRQLAILADLDAVRCVQWRDGGWKSLLTQEVQP